MPISPNDYVPYHDGAAQKAVELSAGKTQYKAYKAITAWVKHSFVYDYVKAYSVAKQKGVLPDVDGCWAKHMGICQDIASMTVGMLRAVGISARFVIGWAGKQYHAWVEADIGGKTYRFDHAAGLIKPKYKAERWY